VPRPEGPYRRAESASGPRLTIHFLPQFRVYLAPIVALVAFLALSGAWSGNLTQGAYLRTLNCESTLGPGSKVVYANCSAGQWEHPIRCSEAQAELRSALHPGILRGRVRTVDTRDRVVSEEEAEAMLGRCLPTAAPAVNPYSYPSGETRAVYLRMQADDYAQALVITVLVLLALLAFVPSRIVRIRLDPESGTVRVRDAALFRKARGADCLLTEIESVDVIDSRVALVTKTGAPILLSGTDRRPIELQRRTVRRIRAWLEAVRDAPRDGARG
jgi:hypothetical protein